MDELAIARAIGSGERKEKIIPLKDRVDELKDDFKYYKLFISIDTNNSTVNLIHQSAKNYFLGMYL